MEKKRVLKQGHREFRDFSAKRLAESVKQGWEKKSKTEVKDSYPFFSV